MPDSSTCAMIGKAHHTCDQRMEWVVMDVRLFFTLALAVLLLPSCAPPQDGNGQFCATLPPESRHCTVFTIAKGDQVFFGGNDDYINTDSTYWVDPGGAAAFGAIWIGTLDNVQQGVNERGLAYDANGLPRVDVASHPERIRVTGDYTSYPIQILRECATVEEVIDWVNTHQWHTYMHDQMQFADASGDAVVISAGTDGELVFTRKPHGDGFLVSTNFNVANPLNGYGYPCSRYDKAQDVLSQLVSRPGELEAPDAAAVLDAVHVEGSTSWTLASMLADLPHGLVYLYYFYQFDRPVVLDVAKEIAQARTDRPLSELFPDDVRQEAARRYQHIQATRHRCRWAGMTWLALVLVCLAALIVLSAYNRPRLGPQPGLVFWIPLVTLLGPLGLLVRFAVGRRQVDGWRAALLEAAGDVLPVAVAFAISLTTIILVPAAQASEPLQIVLILGLPLTCEWLIFQGLLLAPATRKGYLRTLGQRLPQALVAANLGLAGVIAVGMPLVNGSLSACPIMPFSAWTVAAWWAIAALGALPGCVLLWLYEYWAVRHGFQGWGVLASGQGDVRTPSWRRLWWWILLSFVALCGGLVVAMLIR